MLVSSVRRLVFGFVALTAVTRGSSLSVDVTRWWHRRQLTPPGAEPSQCESDCATFRNLGTTCPDLQLSCICTASYNEGYKSCYDCIFSSSNDYTAEFIEQVQQALTIYEQGCNNAGFAVASLTISAAADLPPPTGSDTTLGGGATPPPTSTPSVTSSSPSSLPSSPSSSSAPSTQSPAPSGNSTSAPSSSSVPSTSATSGAEKSGSVGMGLLAICGLVTLLC